MDGQCGAHQCALNMYIIIQCTRTSIGNLSSNSEMTSEQLTLLTHVVSQGVALRDGQFVNLWFWNNEISSVMRPSQGFWGFREKSYLFSMI